MYFSGKLCCRYWEQSEMVRSIRGAQAWPAVCEEISVLEIGERNEEASEVCLFGKLCSVTKDPWDC